MIFLFKLFMVYHFTVKLKQKHNREASNAVEVRFAKYRFNIIISAELTYLIFFDRTF